MLMLCAFNVINLRYNMNTNYKKNIAVFAPEMEQMPITLSDTLKKRKRQIFV